MTAAGRPRGVVRRWLRRGAVGLVVLLAVAAGAITWHVRAKLPQRTGELTLAGLNAPVQVRYDEWGVPHIEARNEDDLYRALGYLHAQDRLFQMEMLRRLARGELAEILGPRLLETDRLFRTLGIRERADQLAAAGGALNAQPAAAQALRAYLEGVNQYQATRPAPLEFEILGIPKRPFSAADTLSIAGYLAYSFAAAFRTEPALTAIRDQLGPDYLRIFELDWKPGGELQAGLPSSPSSLSAPRGLAMSTLPTLARLAAASERASALAGLPQFEGSNAWVVAGSRTASGKPLLAGDPHIAYSAPAVWWEAHLKTPSFELYGHHLALNPMALLGHNERFGWSLTMFQNDDIDLIAEKLNPANPNEVWLANPADAADPAGGRWVALTSRQEIIKVKGQPDQVLTLRRSPHGPIINDAVPGDRGERPIAMWWAFLETDNPVLQAFYQLGRADTLPKAREAASLIHAPGLNIVWANAGGDIAWWAAARLPIRPDGVNPSFLLDGSTHEADKLGFRPFSDNPQEENPARGYIVSANFQPESRVPVPGYYNLGERGRRLDGLLNQGRRWDLTNSQALQLDVQTDYGPRVLRPLIPLLRLAASGEEQSLVEALARWNGAYRSDGLAPVLFQQFLTELLRATMKDELGDLQFDNLRRTRALDHALPRLVADSEAPWWDNRATPQRETQAEIVRQAWKAAVAHLQRSVDPDSNQWRWAGVHTLTHEHPLGKQAPLDRLFNVGPFPVPGGHEVPNNFAQRGGDAPWTVAYGPSTRRLIDFALPQEALGINPVGQSGVWPDRHYSDQAEMLAQGRYRRAWLSDGDIQTHSQGRLVLKP
ncbi:penicillin acylase family protein [Roseateles amylovorans]|uniref:Penicillin acylase family protein n=1 Tax=Roseateles amylovorans TaxID=2978473 RepID=A0ABY6B0H3_9BURK|nr:penicillin acylase family protein [Roseateles amylovorans]UXH78702.1 penicillin acylase family protein [Roseateles amylovorans]